MSAPRQDSFSYGDSVIAYSIRRSKERRTIAITVCGPLVEVTAPSGMKATAIRPHVEKKAAWIIQKQDLARHHKPIYPAELQSGVSIRVFGRQHQLRILPSNTLRPSLELRARQLRLHLPEVAPIDSGQRLIKAALRKQLELRLPEMLAHYASILRIPLPGFQVRELGNRWGSCTPTGSLRFHWLLATQDIAFVRQVVAHELCHLVEPRHSDKFRKLLARILPS